MKVKDLIKQLKSMGQNLEVYSQDHDHSHFDINGMVKSVTEIDQSEMTEWDWKMGGPLLPKIGKYVVLRIA